jgi:hypothetical protein
VPNQARTSASATVIVAPKNGGITITIEAPASCASKLRRAVIPALKWLVATMTGSRPPAHRRV